MTHSGTAMLALALVAALAACDAGPRGDASAGAADTTRWSLGPAEVRVGGGAAGDELDRVYAGVLLADGSFVVGNSGTSELRWFDSSGRRMRVSGRTGSGPGEFRGINWMAALSADSLLVFDLRQQRFSVWTPSGEFARTFMAQTPPGPLRPLGVLADGSMVVARESRYDPRSGAGVVRDSMQVLHVSRTGEVMRTLGSFAGAEWLIYDHPSSFRATQLPFGRVGHVAVAGDHVVVGSSESGSLSVLDREGRRLRTVDVDARPRAVSRRQIDTVLEQIPDRAERAALERHYRADGASAASVFTALRGDDAGNVWIRLAPAAGRDTVKWVVLSADGVRVGSVGMPSGWWPLDVRDDRVLLRETDADGVQAVSVRTLR